MVEDIALSCDGTRIFSTTEDFTWKVRNSCVSMHGERAAIGMENGRLTVLHWISNEVVFESYFAGKVTGVKFCPNGQYLAVASQDCNVQLVRTDD